MIRLTLTLPWFALLPLVAHMSPDLSVEKIPDGGNRFREESFIKEDREHIGEHLKEGSNLDVSKMTEDELEFHFFHLHDTNDDYLLDGLEIFSALQHSYYHKRMTHETYKNEAYDITTEQGKQFFKTIHDSLIDTVDTILVDEDLNKDGYLSYAEFINDTVDKILVDEDLNQDGYLTYAEFINGRRTMGLFKLWGS